MSRIKGKSESTQDQLPWRRACSPPVVAALCGSMQMQATAPAATTSVKLRMAPPALELAPGGSFPVASLPSPQAILLPSPLGGSTPTSRGALAPASVLTSAGLQGRVVTEETLLRPGLADLTDNVTNRDTAGLAGSMDRPRAAPAFPGLEPLRLEPLQLGFPTGPGLTMPISPFGFTALPSPMGAGPSPGGLQIPGLRSPGPLGSPVTAVQGAQTLPPAKRNPIRRL